LSDNKIDTISSIRYEFRRFTERDFYNTYPINDIKTEFDSNGKYIGNN
jgi:hypothetical protein